MKKCHPSKNHLAAGVKYLVGSEISDKHTSVTVTYSIHLSYIQKF